MAQPSPPAFPPHSARRGLTETSPGQAQIFLSVGSQQKIKREAGTSNSVAELCRRTQWALCSTQMSPCWRVCLPLQHPCSFAPIILILPQHLVLRLNNKGMVSCCTAKQNLLLPSIISMTRQHEVVGRFKVWISMKWSWLSWVLLFSHPPFSNGVWSSDLTPHLL